MKLKNMIFKKMFGILLIYKIMIVGYQLKFVLQFKLNKIKFWFLVGVILILLILNVFISLILMREQLNELNLCKFHMFLLHHLFYMEIIYLQLEMNIMLKREKF